MAITEQVKEFEEKVIAIDRVARVVKGGRRFRFRAVVVVGGLPVAVGQFECHARDCHADGPGKPVTAN